MTDKQAVLKELGFPAQVVLGQQHIFWLLNQDDPAAAARSKARLSGGQMPGYYGDFIRAYQKITAKEKQND